MVRCISASNIARLHDILVRAQGGPLKLPVALPVVRVEIDASAPKALIRVLFDLNDSCIGRSGSGVTRALSLVLAHASRMAEH